MCRTGKKPKASSYQRTASAVWRGDSSVCLGEPFGRYDDHARRSRVDGVETVSAAEGQREPLDTIRLVDARDPFVRRSFRRAHFRT